MVLFSALNEGQLKLFCLNFTETILLSKVNEAERMQQYRHICLLNVSFKIFTKTVTIRLNLVVDHVVQPSENAFMQGRSILGGVVTLHETVHELHQKNEWGHEKVKWYLLQQTLRMKSFSNKWRALVYKFIF
jgi:hypothetical protein